MSNILRYLTGAAALMAAVAVPATVSAKTVQHAGAMRFYKAPTVHQALAKNLKPPKVISGSVVSVSGTTLTITGTDTKTYTVDASGVKLASGLALADILSGDKVVVMGTTSGTTITAKAIHDESFIGRDLVIGKVTAISGSTITLESKGKSTSTTYTVNAGSATITKAAWNKGSTSSSTTIALSDIVAGDRLTVIGSVSGISVTAQSVKVDPSMNRMMKDRYMGKVTAISGSMITIESMSMGKGTSTTYNVDVSAATLTKSGWNKGSAPASTTISLSDITVGDHVTVIGALNGSTITATAVQDMGVMGMRMGEKEGCGKQAQGV